MFAAIIILALVSIASPTELRRQVTPSGRKKLSSTTPIKFIYISKLTSWYGNITVPAALGVPGFTASTLPYNYVCHTFWTYPGYAQDATGLWSNLAGNMGPNGYGNNSKDIQTTLKKNFTNNGVKLMVSAFGSTQAPTSAGINVTDCANKLAQFVKDNQYDGVDIDWQDTPAFQGKNTTGESWLITLTTLLRDILGPDAIITHAPQAPYFSTGLYPQGGYLTVDQKVGDKINFYNVQFYNQGVGTYDTAERLFNVSGDWAPYSSINEITTIGKVPASKVVLGKPATTADGNNGWMSAADLNAAIKAANAYNGWNTGIMFWQFSSDIDGSMCNNSTAGVFANAPEQEEEQEQEYDIV